MLYLLIPQSDIFISIDIIFKKYTGRSNIALLYYYNPQNKPLRHTKNSETCH